MLTSNSPRSFGCVNSIPEVNILPSIVFGCDTSKEASMTKRVLSTKSVILSSEPIPLEFPRVPDELAEADCILNEILLRFIGGLSEVANLDGPLKVVKQ